MELRPGDSAVICTSDWPMSLLTNAGSNGDWVHSITHKLHWNIRERQKGWEEERAARRARRSSTREPAEATALANAIRRATATREDEEEDVDSWYDDDSQSESESESEEGERSEERAESESEAESAGKEDKDGREGGKEGAGGGRGGPASRSSAEATDGTGDTTPQRRAHESLRIDSTPLPNTEPSPREPQSPPESSIRRVRIGQGVIEVDEADLYGR